MTKNEELREHIKNYSNILLQELVVLQSDNRSDLSKIPDENCDLEPYEGTPIEDLVRGNYISGRMDMLDEIKYWIEDSPAITEGLW